MTNPKRYSLMIMSLRTGLLWLVPVLVLLIGWRLTPVTWLELATTTQPDLSADFGVVEQDGDHRWRWAGNQAWLQLPAQHLPGVVTLRGILAPGATVSLTLGAAPAVPLEAPGAAPQLRRYALLLPAQADSLGWVRLRIQGMPAVQIDGRTLSMAVSAARITPIDHGWQLPAHGLILSSWLIPALLGLALWTLGMAYQRASWLAALIGIGLVVTWIAQPLLLYPRLLDLQTLVHLRELWLWWSLVQLVGLAAWPILFWLTPNLPLAGYPMARMLGLVLIGWVTWSAALLGLVLFRASTLVAVWALLALAGWGLLLWSKRHPRHVGTWLRTGLLRHGRSLVGWELLFITGLGVGMLLRWYGAVGPALTGTEKPMAIAMINAMLRYEQFPPLAPWFAGYGLHYYYAGHLLVAAIAKVAGTPGIYAFNLGFALIVALTVVGIAYFASALARTLRPVPQRTAWLLPGLALIFCLVAGSQFGALQALTGTHLVRALDAGQIASVLLQRARGATLIELERPTPPSWDGPPITTIVPSQELSLDWFRASRALYDDVPLPEGGVERRYAITEFPAFTLYLGEVHPHVLAMPFHLLSLTMALALLSWGVPRQSSTSGRSARGGVRDWLASLRLISPWPITLRFAMMCIVFGFLIGFLYTLHSWDTPTYALILVGSLLLYLRTTLFAGRLQSAIPAPWWTRLLAWLWPLALLASTTVIVTVPFRMNFVPPAGPPLDHWIADLPILGRLSAILGLAQQHTQLHSFVIIFGLFCWPLIWAALTPIPLHHPPMLALSWGQRLALFGITLALGMFLGMPLLFLVLLVAGLMLRAWQAAGDQPAEALVSWMAAVGTIVVLVTEVVYIRDQLEGQMDRMNTIYKFFFQVWLVWGLAAAYLLVAQLRAWSQQADLLRMVVLKAFYLAPVSLLLAGALVYPFGLMRWATPWLPGERTLDGLAFLARSSPDEYAAAQWLAAQLPPEAVLLTGFCNCEYERVSRIAAITGVQSLLGWLDGHERLWRSGDPEQVAEIARRERDIPLMYTGPLDQALALLEAYGVDYVYLGPMEWQLYGRAIPLLEVLPVAFAYGDVLVLQVAPEPVTP